MEKIKPLWQKIKEFIVNLNSFSIKKKIIIILIITSIIGGGVFAYQKFFIKKEVSYETSAANKGTLTISISSTGTISSGNSTNITTAATGTVKTVYVINGDKVVKGQKIAELTLDEYGVEQQATAWSNYIDTLNAVKTAEKQKDQYDVDMW